MNRIFNYQRKNYSNRIEGKIIELGNAGSFMEIRKTEPALPDEVNINDALFRSIHLIEHMKNKRIFTAYKSNDEPSILLIVWENYPFYKAIEEGGDFMLQTLYEDRSIHHIIIDNTYVMSGWMEDKIIDYMRNGWLPGLIEQGLKSLCHLEAGSYLGGQSFHEFGDFFTDNINSISKLLNKEPFNYFPVKTSNNIKIIDNIRSEALQKAFNIIKSIQK